MKSCIEIKKYISYQQLAKTVKKFENVSRLKNPFYALKMAETYL